ncbi:pyridoxal-phosphate-dependent aminotransferase family protein [Desulfoplanes formicivorans]|uniref:Aminotransferase n=1 Tax=Desulfoplanes formicivorans TaxID=1592317 RepID=A0A194AHL8_9BACT|nr:alanine--glyoxylate aminotransferase family protein [Desulfoplanes formicivorans]GAU08710.1 aminotransferase [Desulfoplanes formicivorans]
MLNKQRLLTPGPTPLPEDVRLAMAQDMIHHRKPAFKKIMGEIQQGLQHLFGTSQPVLPLTCSGTGAMTAAVTNLFQPGETVLVIEGGKFGERWSAIAESHGLEMVILPVPWGKPVKVIDVLNSLDRWPAIKGILIQASETSTGVLHPIQEIGEMTRKRDVQLVVDGISAVGVSPCPMDEWGIDCLLTGSQKGLMLPPGLAFIALSQRAWERVHTVKSKQFYFNLPKERLQLEQQQTLFTPGISLLVGLAKSLEHFKGDKLQQLFRKQWALTMMARAGISAMGLELLALERFTWGLTSLLMPPGVDASDVLATMARDYGVVAAGGQGAMKGKMIRLGHMGHVDWSDLLAGLYALRQSYVACGGYSGCQNYLELAMKAYEQGLEQHVSA